MTVRSGAYKETAQVTYWDDGNITIVASKFGFARGPAKTWHRVIQMSKEQHQKLWEEMQGVNLSGATQYEIIDHLVAIFDYLVENERVTVNE